MMQAWFRKAAPAATAVAAVATTSTAMAQGNGVGRYDHMMWNGGWAHWIMGPLMMILFVGLIVFGIVAVIRWLGPPDQRGRQTGGSSARAILEERFARGEIDEKEFSERKRALES